MVQDQIKGCVSELRTTKEIIGEPLPSETGRRLIRWLLFAGDCFGRVALSRRFGTPRASACGN